MREVNKHFKKRKKESRLGVFCPCVFRVTKKMLMSHEVGKATFDADKKKS